MYILNYACTTAAGPDVDSLMRALHAGRDCSQPAYAGGRACYIDGTAEKSQSFQNTLQSHFASQWKNLRGQLPTELYQAMQTSRVGLIFASTKGFVEDFIWHTGSDRIRDLPDPFFQISADFCDAQDDIPWAFQCNVSNACSSSHVAFEYAQDLFRQDRLDYILVLAADLVGPFIYKGFSSLKVISPTTNRPFSGDREGLQLGEAVTMILLSRNKKSDADMRILSVASDTEGSSITRPSVNGLGLVRAMDKIQSEIEINPDLVVAHGTGTKFNDLAEELALRQYLGRLKKPQTPITNTKWCIGHTLGASGSVDLIAAAEILRNQRVFKIQNTSQRDPEFEMNYLTADSAPEKINNVQQILISSLGFGGIHAALMVLREKGSSEN